MTYHICYQLDNSNVCMSVVADSLTEALSIIMTELPELKQHPNRITRVTAIK